MVCILLFLSLAQGKRLMTKEVVLIFDQDPHTRWVLKTLLEGERYIVIAHGEIERLKQNFKEFEICGLIVEYRPDQNDLVDFVHELKKGFPELYIMMLTRVDVSDRDYKQILNAGVDDFFLKPFSSEKILLHLQKGLKQRKLVLQKRQIEKKLMKMKLKTKAMEMGDREGSLAVSK